LGGGCGEGDEIGDRQTGVEHDVTARVDQQKRGPGGRRLQCGGHRAVRESSEVA
jgi:hypothetical protein